MNKQHSVRRLVLFKNRVLLYTYRNVSTFKGIQFGSSIENAERAFKDFARVGMLSKLAPSNWEHAGDISKTYVPFWLFDISGNVSYDVDLGSDYQERIKTGNSYSTITRTRWTRSHGETSFEANDVYTYAATTFERSMIAEVVTKSPDVWEDLKRNSKSMAYTSPEYKVDIYTIDNDTAYYIAQEEQMMNMVREACERHARSQHPGYSRYQVKVSRVQPNIHSENLFYFPMFVLQTQYRGKIFNSFLDGRHVKDGSQVVGYRQYSFAKSFIAAFVGVETIYGGIAMFESMSFEAFKHAMISFAPFATILSVGLAYAAMNWSTINQWRHRRQAEYIGQRFMSAEARETIQQQKMYDRFRYDEGGQYQQQNYKKYQKQYQQQQQYQRQSYQQQQQYQQQYQQSSYQRQYEQYQQQRQQSRPGTSIGFNEEIRKGIDFYTLLGLDPKSYRTYKPEEIKKAYRVAAVKNHPDLQPPEKKDAASEKFKLINQAYAVLGDESKRQTYHQTGREGVR